METHKGRKPTSYYCCDVKASSNSLSPLIFYKHQPTGGSNLKFCKLQLARKIQSPSIFCKLQPTRGSYLNQIQMDIYQATTWNGSTKSHVCSIGYNPQEGRTSNYASYNLQGSSNSQIFSAGYNLQEASTSPKSNWKFIKLQLERRLQSPHSTRKSYVDLPGY